ncbi:hypothetical protein [uncultured Desulfovibrio sp.]|uniref:hypothetical protein n=1 Tax=uncultured Desulfovibrio sp. TaxID=167968 RepID=UPI002627E5BF|nr:hypothetical protein [uncultured Desulfovibrio sp.]
MTQQSRSSQPAIATKLNVSPGLTPTVRASSVITYDEARPGYVERDNLAGNDMGRLAKSLAAVDSSLIPVLEKYQDRKIEQAIARGGELFSQNEAQDKNRTNWKDYVEANPQDSGMNPYLQKGYEQARLKSLAIDQGTAMEDAFVQSGMVNERDPAKVSQWVQQFTQQFRKDNNLDAYGDRLTLAENFSPIEFKNRAVLLNKHNTYLQEQNEKIAMQQFTDLGMKQIGAAFNPSTGGAVPGDPSTDHHTLPNMAQTIEGTMQEAAKNGVLNSHIGEMGLKMVEAAYFKYGKQPGILKALDAIKTPDGVPLSSLPGAQEKIDHWQRARIEEARSNERHWWAKQEHDRKVEKDYWAGEGVMKWDTGAPPTPDNMDKAGVPKRLQPLFAADINKWHQSQYTGQKDAPAHQVSVVGYRMMADIGELSNEDITGVAPVLGREYAEDLYDRHSKSKKEEETHFTSSLKDTMSKAFSMFSRDKKDLMDAINAMTFGFSAGLSKEQQIGLEASQLANAKMKAARAEYVDKNKKSPTQEFYTTIQPKILSEVNTQLREKYGKTGEADENGVQVPTSQKNVTSQQPQNKVQNTVGSSSPERLPNTVVSSWIAQNVPNAPPSVSNMDKREAALWLKGAHPDKFSEFNNYINANRKR